MFRISFASCGESPPSNTDSLPPENGSLSKSKSGSGSGGISNCSILLIVRRSPASAALSNARVSSSY